MKSAPRRPLPFAPASGACASADLAIGRQVKMAAAKRDLEQALAWHQQPSSRRGLILPTSTARRALAHASGYPGCASSARVNACSALASRMRTMGCFGSSARSRRRRRGAPGLDTGGSCTGRNDLQAAVGSSSRVRDVARELDSLDIWYRRPYISPRDGSCDSRPS